MAMRRVESAETPAADLRRIAVELLDDALHRMRSRSVKRRGRVIHEVRKRFKETRAVISLLADDSRARRAAHLLRDVGRSIAAGRDADSVLATFDRMRLRRSLDPADYERMRSCLAGECLVVDLRPLRPRVMAVREEMARWIVPESPESLTRAVGRAYRAARRSMDEAVRSGSVEHFHEFRKRAKAHWYHSQVLAGIVPELESREKRLHALSRSLGAHHDLALLLDAVKRHGDQLSEDGRATLTDRVRSLAMRREEESILAGSELFAERPRDWKSRLTPEVPAI
jgi:hypothetical protein